LKKRHDPVCAWKKKEARFWDRHPINSNNNNNNNKENNYNNYNNKEKAAKVDPLACKAIVSRYPVHKQAYLSDLFIKAFFSRLF